MDPAIVDKQEEVPPLDKPIDGHPSTKKGTYIHLGMFNQSFCDEELMVSPISDQADGFNDISMLNANISRLTVFKLFDMMQSTEFFNKETGEMFPAARTLEVFKTTQWRLDP